MRLVQGLASVSVQLAVHPFIFIIGELFLRSECSLHGSILKSIPQFMLGFGWPEDDQTKKSWSLFWSRAVDSTSYLSETLAPFFRVNISVLDDFAFWINLCIFHWKVHESPFLVEESNQMHLVPPSVFASAQRHAHVFQGNLLHSCRHRNFICSDWL